MPLGSDVVVMWNPVYSTSAEELFDTTPPEGPVPVAFAVLVTTAADTSAEVVVVAPVQVSWAPGASELLGQETDATLLSETAKFVRVVVPLLVTK